MQWKWRRSAEGPGPVTEREVQTDQKQQRGRGITIHTDTHSCTHMYNILYVLYMLLELWCFCVAERANSEDDGVRWAVSGTAFSLDLWRQGTEPPHLWGNDYITINYVITAIVCVRPHTYVCAYKVHCVHAYYVLYNQCVHLCVNYIIVAWYDVMITSLLISLAGGVFGKNDGVLWFLQLLKAVAVDPSLAEWPRQQDKHPLSSLSHPCRPDGWWCHCRISYIG